MRKEQNPELVEGGTVCISGDITYYDGGDGGGGVIVFPGVWVVFLTFDMSPADLEASVLCFPFRPSIGPI
jgi:formylmethanofuran dehydrogenase subunit C